MIKKSIFIFLLVSVNFTLFAQQDQPQVDSLLKELQKTKEDTNRVNIQIGISYAYLLTFDSAYKYAQNALVLSETLKWKYGITDALYQIGCCYYMDRSNVKSLDYALRALKMSEELTGKSNLHKEAFTADILSLLAKIHINNGDFDNAIICANKVIKLELDLQNTDGFFEGLSLVQHIYSTMPDYDKELGILFTTLYLYKLLNKENEMEYTYWLIADNYNRQKKYTPALKYAFKSIKMTESSGSKNGIKRKIVSIGDIYKNQGNYTSALRSYNEALKIDSENGNKEGMADEYNKLIKVYLQIKNYSKAIALGYRILRLYREYDTVNTKYAFGNIGVIYYEIAKDTTGNIKQDSLISANKNSNLHKAYDYLIASGIRTKLIEKRATYTEDHTIALIETQKMLRDYKGALENLENFKAMGDSQSLTTKNTFIEKLKIEHAVDEINKQMVIDKMTELEEQNEWIFYSVSFVLLFLVVVFAFLLYIGKQKKTAKILKTSNNTYLEHLSDNKRLLEEIAHIQSHDVRGPLSSILGLMQFFNYEDLADPINKELMEGISESAFKLDTVIKKVVFKTYEKNRAI